jgi:hypothetical protein
LTKDGNFVFRVVKQWFSLPQGSTFAKSLSKAERAIITFEHPEKKHPTVVDVKPNYTGQQLRDATCG